MKFVLATSNKHKTEEFKALLAPYALETVGSLDVSEDKDTYAGNSLAKLDALVDWMFEERDGINADTICIADDSGIEIDALGGGPGIRSSRFLPELTQDEKNRSIVEKVRETGKTGARFVCCISFFAGKSQTKRQVISQCSGRIISDAGDIVRTDWDFGYDPIFVPDGFDKPFNVLTKDIKNKVSHRALAVRGMLKMLAEGKC